jgi:AraC-like DNA-binding protein
VASRIAKTYGLQPRGVLKSGADEKRFRYLRRLPAPDVGVFVEHFWMIRWDLRGIAPHNAQTVSHPSVQLGLQEGKSRIYGVVKGKSSHVLRGVGEIFGVKFRPGGFYPFLKSPLSRITNRSIPLKDVFGADAKELEQSVLSLEFGAQRADAAENFLRQRLPERDQTALLAGQMVDEICLNPEIMTVDDLVARFRLGKRMLQRLFDQYIGVTPKWVIRVYRLHQVVERLNSGKAVDFAALAQDLGYFDQAHFVKDFKSIVGHTPAGYLKQLRK